MPTAEEAAQATFQLVKVGLIAASEPGELSIGMALANFASWISILLNKIRDESWDSFRLEPGFGSLWYALMLVGDDIFWDFLLGLWLDSIAIVLLAREIRLSHDCASRFPGYSLYWLTNPGITYIDSWFLTLKLFAHYFTRLTSTVTVGSPRTRRTLIALLGEMASSHLPLAAILCIQSAYTILLYLWTWYDQGNPNVLFFLGLAQSGLIAVVELA